MQSPDATYLELVKHILDNGVQKGDRTGTGTLSVFGYQMRFDLSGGKIPLLTTKKMFTRGIIHEILWYLQGATNIKYLTDNNVNFWNDWADDAGELGPVYGKQWRNWEARGKTIDQIAQVVDQLRTNPNDRRIIVNAWNVAEIDEMALPPCHLLFQFWANKGKLSCHLYQRSCDVGLGVPFNIVQYSILTHMFAQVTGHKASEFIWTGGDTHIYNNHIDQLTQQLEREPYPTPRLRLNPLVFEIDDFYYEHFEIEGYKSHGTIKMEISV